MPIDEEQYAPQQFTVEVHRGPGALPSLMPGIYAHVDELTKIRPQAKVQRGTTSEQLRPNPSLPSLNAGSILSTAADNDAGSDLKEQSRWKRLIG